jgi:hypothetical protein
MNSGLRWIRNLRMTLFRSEVTRDQCKDTGMAMVLIFLLLTLIFNREIYLIGAICLHVLNMVFPRAYRPVAVLWLGLAHLLGTVVSRIVLTVVFLTVVTPIGLARRLLGVDSLKLKEFKKDDGSVMHERNHKFTAEDIQRPY